MKNLSMKRMLMFAFAFVMVAACVVIPNTKVNAAGYGTNGYHCTKKNLSSGRLLIGDSRTCQLWNYKNAGASVVAVWGGHYGYGGSTNQIDTTSQRETMKSYARQTIKKKGYCDIYVFATVNDYNGGSGHRVWADRVISLAKTAYSWSYNGIHPTVHVVSLVGGKGKSVTNYNKYLKSQVSENKSKIKGGYVSIGNCLAGSNGGYSSDGLHYNNTTLKNIWKKLN